MRCPNLAHPVVLTLALAAGLSSTKAADDKLTLGPGEYLEMPGLNVMLANDYYPEGHQGGVGIIQNGKRVATNGDLRLDRTPGQWQPTPVVVEGSRKVNKETGEISVRMSYPDDAKNRKGFNPIEYPDLRFSYTLHVLPEGHSFRIRVDLDSPLPEAFADQVSFNLELFPGLLFGRSFQLDQTQGIFPRQADGPGELSPKGEYVIAPLATGKRLVVAPEVDTQRMVIESVAGAPLELIDGRGPHTNGWFVVRSVVPKGATHNSIEWLVSANALPGFIAEPVVQVSQVGYTLNQPKTAVIELDPRDKARPAIEIVKIDDKGSGNVVSKPAAKAWGHFLRSDYLVADFSEVKEPGMYAVRYGSKQSNPFRIGSDVLDRHVWQPTLEYFLPIQMCHMRVADRYQVWHGACHLDDARMAPINLNHFDGYLQGPSTLTHFKSGDHVPNLDRGGWHDAGDHDLRVESQAETVYGLALAHEAFGVAYDQTTIDQENHFVELHRPDGKDDVLQQVEHGLLTIVGGYKSLGRLYRGLQEVSLRQYVLLGDPVNATDNQIFDEAKAGKNPPPIGLPGSPDDRWVFTEENAFRELDTAACLAAASRVMKGYNDELSADCRRIATELWDRTKGDKPGMRVGVAVELLLATGDKRYADWLVANEQSIVNAIDRVGWVIGRALPVIKNEAFTQAIHEAVSKQAAKVEALAKETPYGVPYRPDIWGAGWNIQHFGMEQYFLHRSFPDLVPNKYLLDAMNFVLGCHPGQNTASFASGVGSHSATVAYGFNRADWTYIPGGIVSGTAIIRPDFPELLEWPFLWQQTEYVLGGGTTDYLFLVLGSQQVLKSSNSVQ